MELHLLRRIFTLLSVVLVASHAALPSEDYWKSVLPNTPMPKAVRNLLRYSVADTSVDAWKNGLIITNTEKGKTQITKAADVYVKYAAAATVEELHHMSNIAIFFLEKDLHQGTSFNLILTKTTNAANFLPRQVSGKIPFSSNKLPQILNQLSLKPNTKESKMLEETIKECEEPGLKGEERYCATSLESMVDYITSKLGGNVKAISTETQKDTQLQEYKITGVKKMGAESSIVCHKRNYAYAVFYCHKTDNIRAYMVTLVDGDGAKAKAVVECHIDTSAWNPKHLAFQLLKVKPGVVPVCHFLPEDTVVWVPY